MIILNQSGQLWIKEKIAICFYCFKCILQSLNLSLLTDLSELWFCVVINPCSWRFFGFLSTILYHRLYIWFVGFSTWDNVSYFVQCFYQWWKLAEWQKWDNLSCKLSSLFIDFIDYTRTLTIVFWYFVIILTPPGT